MGSGSESEVGDAHVWTVSGMDCAACASKIRGALERLPGVSEVNVSVMAERLTLTLGENATTKPDQIEQAVERLGYGVSRRKAGNARANSPDEVNGKVRGFRLPDDASAPTPTAEGARGSAPPETRTDLAWYQAAKGRLVIVTGGLLAVAWAAKLVLPGAITPWVFVLACLLGVAPVARRAFAAFRVGMPFTIEMLMTIAAAGALVIGAAEEAALVVFLFAVGEVLEAVAADRARASIRALGDLVPKSAWLVEEGGATRKIDAAALEIGQTVLVRPGDRVPADGDIVEGVSGIDESPVTGESVPRTKGPGEPVFAGSINTEAALHVLVTTRASDNTIARIIRLVEEAQEARAPTERFIDRFSRWYMPAIVGLALLVAILPPLLFAEPWETWIYRALALLLIGCPCALVISVPASIASGLSAGARRGLLMKGGAVIEAAALTEVVTFDKTGTLTVGKPKVTDVVAFAGSEADVLALAAGVETGSSHPLAEAVLREAEARAVRPEPVTGTRVLPGQGVEGVTADGAVFVGSPRYAEALGVVEPAAMERIGALEGEGKTVAAVFRHGAVVGLIASRDEPREDAVRAVAELKQLGVRSIMLTGDNGRTAAAIAGALGMDHRAELMPDEKVAAIRAIAVQAKVMMVGDGINDAPALAAAHLGIAMGSGTDVALETADGALLRNRVTDVAAMTRLARATMSNIRQNITIALGLKAVFLVTTVLGITGLWIAILADTGATVIVTLNALRLLGFNPERQG